LNALKITPPWKLYRGWWVVAAGFGALFVSSGATGFGFSVMIKPIEQAMAWNRATTVGVLSAAGIVSGIMSAPLGFVVDRYGARAVMVVSAFAGGLALMLLAFVTAPWQYYLVMGVGVGAARAGLSGLAPRAAVANWFIRKRASAFAILASGTAASGLLIVPLLAWIVENLDWRAAWVALGLMEWLLVIPLSWIFIRRRPEDIGLLPDGDDPAGRASSPRTGEASSGPISPIREANWTRRQALRTRTYWLLIFSFMLTGFPGGTIFIHMVPYFTGKGLSPAMAASALSTYAAGVLVGRAVWGYTVGRTGIHHALVAYALSYGTAIAAFIIAPSPAAIFFTVFVLGIAIGGSQQLHGQVWPDYYGREIVGSLTGFSGILSTPAHAAGPLLAAIIYDTTKSYTGTFAVFSAITLIASVTLYFAKKPVPPAPAAREAVASAIGPGAVQAAPYTHNPTRAQDARPSSH